MPRKLSENKFSESSCNQWHSFFIIYNSNQLKTNKMKATANPTTYTKEKSSSRLEKFFVDELKDIYWAEKT